MLHRLLRSLPGDEAGYIYSHAASVREEH